MFATKRSAAGPAHRQQHNLSYFIHSTRPSTPRVCVRHIVPHAHWTKPGWWRSRRRRWCASPASGRRSPWHVRSGRPAERGGRTRDAPAGRARTVQRARPVGTLFAPRGDVACSPCAQWLLSRCTARLGCAPGLGCPAHRSIDRSRARRPAASASRARALIFSCVSMRQAAQPCFDSGTSAGTSLLGGGSPSFSCSPCPTTKASISLSDMGESFERIRDSIWLLVRAFTSISSEAPAPSSALGTLTCREALSAEREREVQ